MASGVNLANVGLTYVKYQQGFVRSLNDDALTFKMPKQEKWRGSNIEGRIHIARTTAMGFTEDGGAYPDPNKQDYTPYRVGRRFWQGKIQLTEGILAAAKASPQVARDALESEVQGMTTDAAKFYNGMFFRDGTGVVATLDDAGLASGTTDISVDDSRMLWPGLVVEVYDTTLATKRGETTVVSVESALNTAGAALVNFSAAVTGAVSTDVLVWKGSLNRAISGLDALINDNTSGTLQDVSLSDQANSKWSCMVVDNGTVDEEMNPSKLRTLLAGIRQKAGRSKVNLKVLGDAWQSVEFEEMYEGELRLTPASKKGGAAISSFISALGRIDLETDTDCTRGTVYAIDPGKLTHYVQRKMGWVPEGSGGIFKKSHTNSVRTAVMLCISQMAIKERHTCGRINDLSDEATIAFG